ncbi:MAG: NADH-quinone oxidoreductase subunit C [Chitinophagaceae bacterium]|nr:NADH-quinone oxidoreductase subunit C [Chitinophagaceae bacterium]
MTNDELKIELTTLFPTMQIEEGGEWLNGFIEPLELLSVIHELKNNINLKFDYLFCLTCVDFKSHLTMVYHLSSTTFHHSVVIKSKLDIANPQIETLSNLYRTAEFHEREVYEMFGVNFLNHPDLRLLILPDGWEGKNPMRKDFEDPINMIKL